MTSDSKIASTSSSARFKILSASTSVESSVNISFATLINLRSSPSLIPSSYQSCSFSGPSSSSGITSESTFLISLTIVLLRMMESSKISISSSSSLNKSFSSMIDGLLRLGFSPSKTLAPKTSRLISPRPSSPSRQRASSASRSTTKTASLITFPSPSTSSSPSSISFLIIVSLMICDDKTAPRSSSAGSARPSESSNTIFGSSDGLLRSSSGLLKTILTATISFRISPSSVSLSYQRGSSSSSATTSSESSSPSLIICLMIVSVTIIEERISPTSSDSSPGAPVVKSFRIFGSKLKSFRSLSPRIVFTARKNARSSPSQRGSSASSFTTKTASSVTFPSPSTSSSPSSISFRMMVSFMISDDKMVPKSSSSGSTEPSESSNTIFGSSDGLLRSSSGLLKTILTATISFRISPSSVSLSYQRGSSSSSATTSSESSSPSLIICLMIVSVTIIEERISPTSSDSSPGAPVVKSFRIFGSKLKSFRSLSPRIVFTARKNARSSPSQRGSSASSFTTITDSSITLPCSSTLSVPYLINWLTSDCFRITDASNLPHSSSSGSTEPSDRFKSRFRSIKESGSLMSGLSPKRIREALKKRRNSPSTRTSPS